MRKAILNIVDWIAAGMTFLFVMVLAVYIVFVETIRALIQFVKEMWYGPTADVIVLLVLIAAILWCAFRWKIVRNIV
jgi:hypothetical protein